jgi:hypothetical protein
MIDTYLRKGDKRFAISSSGNAALAAALYVRKLNQKISTDEKSLDHDKAEDLIDLDIFVGNHVAPHKLQKLRDIVEEKAADGISNNGGKDGTDHIRLLIKERPLQALMQATNEGMRSLRQSTDDTALVGYRSLAEEIVEGIEASAGKSSKISSKKTSGAIFIGTSSGTTAQALASYFIENKSPIQVHIVQTSSCHPMSDAFGPYEGSEESSIADAIVDITALRKSALIPLIEKTGGRGWFVATNEDIETAQKLVRKHTDLDISTNSALSVVGAMQAAYTGYEIDGPIICMICGE